MLKKEFPQIRTQHKLFILAMIPEYFVETLRFRFSQRKT